MTSPRASCPLFQMILFTEVTLFLLLHCILSIGGGKNTFYLFMGQQTKCSIASPTTVHRTSPRALGLGAGCNIWKGVWIASFRGVKVFSVWEEEYAYVEGNRGEPWHRPNVHQIHFSL